LRIDIAQHITKHNLLHENENVRNPALWAEATFSEFYLEASYPTDFTYPDAGGNIRTSDSILLTGFPADPFNGKKNDPSRMQSLACTSVIDFEVDAQHPREDSPRIRCQRRCEVFRPRFCNL
jgi:hypothetical protein